MTIFSFDNIKVLRTEITTVCNAQCGGCARKGLSKYFHMSQETWDNLIKDSNLIHIDRIFFNGNYGDFSCHQDSIKYLSEIPKKDIDIVIATNGSTRSLDYWKKLADVLKEFRNHLVIFAIDGTTQEIHSAHRENTRLDRILENALAFINQGGNAGWQFITFQHNKHQIEEAFLLSKSYKFKEFAVQNSYQPIIKNTEGKDLISLSTPEYLSKFYRYRFKDHNLKNITNGIETSCPWTKLQRVQINADGSVWPCCWVGEPIVNVIELPSDYHIPTLNEFTLKEIIESNLYQDFFTSKVNDKSSFCSTKCPAKYDDVKFRYSS